MHSAPDRGPRNWRRNTHLTALVSPGTAVRTGLSDEAERVAKEVRLPLVRPRVAVVKTKWQWIRQIACEPSRPNDFASVDGVPPSCERLHLPARFKGCCGLLIWIAQAKRR